MARGLSSRGPGKPSAVPKAGAASTVGPSGAAPKPRLKNTRDYGKSQDFSAVEDAPPVSPFGAANRPFGG